MYGPRCFPETIIIHYFWAVFNAGDLMHFIVTNKIESMSQYTLTSAWCQKILHVQVFVRTILQVLK